MNLWCGNTFKSGFLWKFVGNLYFACSKEKRGAQSRYLLLSNFGLMNVFKTVYEISVSWWGLITCIIKEMHPVQVISWILIWQKILKWKLVAEHQKLWSFTQIIWKLFDHLIYLQFLLFLNILLHLLLGSLFLQPEKYITIIQEYSKANAM